MNDEPDQNMSLVPLPIDLDGSITAIFEIGPGACVVIDALSIEGWHVNRPSQLPRCGVISQDRTYLFSRDHDSNNSKNHQKDRKRDAPHESDEEHKADEKRRYIDQRLSEIRSFESRYRRADRS
jgi:hypothetical protein